jgi:UDP-glucose 4-epimerase
VLHFAGIGDIVPSVERPADYMQTNVMGTVRVLEAARHAQVRRLVYSASSSCYGAHPPVPTDENCPIVTEYPYALSKYLGEQAAFHWMKVYGLSVNSIRIFNALRHAVPHVRCLRSRLRGVPQAEAGWAGPSPSWATAPSAATSCSSPTSRRPSCAPPSWRSLGRIWNLGSGNPQSVNRLVELLGGPVVHIPRRPGEPAATWADPTAINRDLDWAPTVSFEQGVATVVENIDYWAEAPLWDEESIATATEPWFRLLSESEETV